MDELKKVERGAAKLAEHGHNIAEIAVDQFDIEGCFECALAFFYETYEAGTRALGITTIEAAEMGFTVAWWEYPRPDIETVKGVDYHIASDARDAAVRDLWRELNAAWIATILEAQLAQVDEVESHDKDWPEDPSNGGQF